MTVSPSVLRIIDVRLDLLNPIVLDEQDSNCVQRQVVRHQLHRRHRVLAVLVPDSVVIAEETTLRDAEKRRNDHRDGGCDEEEEYDGHVEQTLVKDQRSGESRVEKRREEFTHF